MAQLRDILKPYASDATFLAAPKPIKAQLSADLAKQAQLNGRLYAVVFAVALVLTLIVVAVLVRDVLGGSEKYAALAAAGLGAPAMLAALQRIGKAWSESNLMLVLVRNSDEATVRNLVRNYVAASAKLGSSSEGTPPSGAGAAGSGPG